MFNVVLMMYRLLSSLWDLKEQQQEQLKVKLKIRHLYVVRDWIWNIKLVQVHLFELFRHLVLLLLLLLANSGNEQRSSIQTCWLMAKQLTLSEKCLVAIPWSKMAAWPPVVALEIEMRSELAVPVASCQLLDSPAFQALFRQSIGRNAGSVSISN